MNDDDKNRDWSVLDNAEKMPRTREELKRRIKEEKSSTTEERPPDADE